MAPFLNWLASDERLDWMAAAEALYWLALGRPEAEAAALEREAITSLAAAWKALAGLLALGRVGVDIALPFLVLVEDEAPPLVGAAGTPGAERPGILPSALEKAPWYSENC